MEIPPKSYVKRRPHALALPRRRVETRLGSYSLSVPVCESEHVLALGAELVKDWETVQETGFKKLDWVTKKLQVSVALKDLLLDLQISSSYVFFTKMCLSLPPSLRILK